MGDRAPALPLSLCRPEKIVSPGPASHLLKEKRGEGNTLSLSFQVLQNLEILAINGSQAVRECTPSPIPALTPTLSFPDLANGSLTNS